MPVVAETRWWETIDRKGGSAGHMRLADLTEWLIENGRRQEIVAMLRAPWNWSDEYERMSAERV